MAVEHTFSSPSPNEARTAGSPAAPQSSNGGKTGILPPDQSPAKPSGASATGQMRIGPPPEWVKVRPIDLNFKPDELENSACLLWDRQEHAERSEYYFRTVHRLDTLQAVQDFARHQIHFDSHSQQLIVHSIAVLRGGQRVEQADMSRFQSIQCGAALAGLPVNGWLTLLLVLENIQVGDVIDASHTIIATPRLLPGRFCRFHTLPFGVPIRALHLEVRFSTNRPLRWKSSSADLKPELQQDGNESRLEWKKENLTEALMEPNLPAWHVAGSWIQVTDCTSWEEVVEGCLKTWPFEQTSPAIKQTAEAVIADARTPDDRADALITFLQDSFRHHEDGSEPGSLVPAPADEVLRRRFGGSKDLALLLTLLLRAVGLPARPVLVNHTLPGRVRDFLPMPQALDHALVEFELGVERRWVDPSCRLQGGGARNRPLRDFGPGLILERGVKALQEMPNPSSQAGTHNLHEFFWLNSGGPWSILEVQIIATGAQADFFRNWFASRPERTIAQEREAFYGRMFPQVKRVGQMVHRDFRHRNEFMFAEMFEVAGALRPLGNGAYGFFAYPAHLVQSTFPNLPKEDRPSPYALPFPYKIEHAISVDFPGLQTGIMPPYNLGTNAFHLSRRSKFSVGHHTVIYAFETLADSVPVDEMREFKSAASEVWYETIFNVEVPSGIAGRRPRHRVPQLQG